MKKKKTVVVIAVAATLMLSITLLKAKTDTFPHFGVHHGYETHEHCDNTQKHKETHHAISQNKASVKIATPKQKSPLTPTTVSTNTTNTRSVSNNDSSQSRNQQPCANENGQCQNNNQTLCPNCQKQHRTQTPCPNKGNYQMKQTRSGRSNHTACNRGYHGNHH